jgi:hypothetical protein
MKTSKVFIIPDIIDWKTLCNENGRIKGAASNFGYRNSPINPQSEIRNYFGVLWILFFVKYDPIT